MQIRNRIKELRQVRASELLPNPRNWRRHPTGQADALRGALAEIGYADALIAYETDEGLMLIDGHLRAETTPDMEVPVLVTDLDEGEANKLLMTLDPLAAMASADTDIFDALRQVTTVESDALQEMLDAIAGGSLKSLEAIPKPKVGLTDPDEVPPEPEEAWVQSGDLFQLGEHRVMCGDSTAEGYTQALMGEHRADITFTSPPYNLKSNAMLSPHQPNGSKYVRGVDSLEDDEYRLLLCNTVLVALTVTDFCFLNVQSLAGNKCVLINLLYELQHIYADTIIWDKQNAQPAMAHRVLNSQFEYVHIFSKNATRVIGTKDFRGAISNIVSIRKRASEEPTMNASFSVEFASFFAEQFCERSIYDPFLGSGTTLIAAEKLGRICYGMEIEPRYVQVAIERWQNYTGQKAVKL